MAITNYLVHFKTEDTYNDKKSELRDDAVAFVKDATIIHTHGSDYYCGSGPVALKSDLSEYATTTALTSGLAGKANVSHTHTISQVSGLQEELNSKLESVSLADLGVTATATELNYVDGVTSNIQTQLNNKAASSHNHSAANITSGTLDLARIPSITDAKITSISASKITGTIPQANLPSYVDDVLEYSSKSLFPKTGEARKIYVDTATNLTYRWGGSSYVEISPSLALGETSSTAFRGDRGKIAYDHSQATGNPHNLTLSNLGISATAAELNFVDGVTSNIQTQLNAKANTSALASYALKNGSNASGTWPISISGNAATATKLATSKSLWGQSFNGTNNVSGDMIGVGRINNGLIISQFGTSADNSDTTRFLINGHQLEFGGYGYAHQNYFFRPQYSASGETYADMYIQNASAADSPVFYTTHCFDHNGNAYHWGNLGLGASPEGYKLDVRGSGRFTGLLTAPGGLFGLTKTQADKYAGNSNYYNLAVGQKSPNMGASLLLYRDSTSYQSYIVWSTNTLDHIGLGLAPDSDDLIIENHKAGIQIKGTGNLTYNGYPLLHSGNYTSYTVTKTGSGASGTWNINISGAAASANSVTWNNVSGKPSTFTPAAHTHPQYSTTDTKNTTGTSNSTSKLYLAGGITQSSTGVVTYSNSAVYTQSGQLYATQMNATNGFYETSDARLKNFKDDVKALNVVSEIPTKYFTWKSDESKTEHIGTSAQEIQKLYPDLVTENEDGVLSVDYARLSIIALAAIKELKAQIDELKSKIN